MKSPWDIQQYRCALHRKHGDGTIDTEAFSSYCFHPTETPTHGAGVRVTTARAPGGFCGPNADKMEFKPCPTAQSTLCTTCLLYTSDAADDAPRV